MNWRTSLNSLKMKIDMTLRNILTLSVFLIVAKIAYAQTPCENGMAGGYPCDGVDLLSHISAQDLLAEEDQGSWLNDIWGWTDPETDKEYALIGMSNGTSFVDVSDPINPIFLGKLNEHHASGKSSEGRIFYNGAKSIWRDLKVYKDHAFIVSEDEDHGMQVFDLTELRGVTSPQEFTETAIYQGIGSAHNIVINEATGFAYAVGANTQDQTCTEGGLHIIDISIPAFPVYRACFDDDGYTHDAQCVIYNGPDEDYQGLEICFNANENSITLVNVDDKDNISMISSVGYSGVQYAHQGWLTEDHRYFLTNDELDEYRDGTNTRTLIWDMVDLENPVLLGTHEHAGKAIDHNLYIVDGLSYQSNYTSGLRIMDLANIAQGELTEKSYFDTYPASDVTSFDGTWSNYPFFSSGTIIVSDVINGLFILKLGTPPVPILPIANFNFTVDANVVSFENKSTDATSYEWNFGDQSPVSDLENPIHEYETGGSYEVNLTATNIDGSHEFTRTASFVYTGITAQAAFDNASIYPNPTSGQLNIKLGKETDRGTSTILTDLQGKVFIQEHISSINTTFVIDIHKIPSGMYYLTLSSDRGTVTKKLIIN